MSRLAHSAVQTIAMVLVVGCQAAGPESGDRPWREKFGVPREGFASTGSNPYFSVEPGFQQVYEGKDHGKAAGLTITVLDETLKVDDVETRVVEERETAGGALKEVSRNYFAIDKETNDVYYFGEDVDNYADGR